MMSPTFRMSVVALGAGPRRPSAERGCAQPKSATGISPVVPSLKPMVAVALVASVTIAGCQL